MKISANLIVVGFMVTSWGRSTHSNTISAAASSGETDGCPATSRWTPKSQSCYLYLNESVNFTQAKGGCEGLGAHLVSIGSEEENRFIVDFVGATSLPIWIGLFRTTTESCTGDSCRSWMWLDGSDQGYSRWATGIPDNSIQCVFVDSQGDWAHSRLCSTQRGYVCEQKRIFPSTTLEFTTISSMGEITNPTSADPDGNLVSTDVATGGKDGNIGLIVGCVVGGLLLVGIIIAATYLVKRYRKNKIAQPNSSSQHQRPLSYRNASNTDQPTREKDSQSSKRDKPSKKKDRKPSQRDKPKKHKDRKSTPKNQSNGLANDDVRTGRVNGNISRDYSYEDVELGTTNKGFKQTPATSSTNAHSGGLNPDQVYAEPTKKKHRPGSEGVMVQENSLYGSGQ